MERMRLQKFLARAGVASRRKCEELIADGCVKVNGELVTEPGCTVDPETDTIEFEGRKLALPTESVVIMLNKPAGYLTAMEDSRGAKVVSSLVPTDKYKGLYPIGRLDKNTTGLLLFTTNGELGHALLHPSRKVDKRYVAHINGVLRKDDFKRLENGIKLDDGRCAPAECKVLECDRQKKRSVVALTIHEGKKRQVRRMFEALGYKVTKLERTDFGPLSLGNLKLGKWRLLNPEEVAALISSCGLR